MQETIPPLQQTCILSEFQILQKIFKMVHYLKICQRIINKHARKLSIRIKWEMSSFAATKMSKRGNIGHNHLNLNEIKPHAKFYSDMLRYKRDIEFYLFPIRLTLGKHTVFTTIRISVTIRLRTMIKYIKLFFYQAEFNGEYKDLINLILLCKNKKKQFLSGKIPITPFP